MPALAYSVSLKSIEAIFGARGFTPSALFSSGEQGAWYDPSDFSTMFQDAAGTTPVTAVEQPVGLLLDKSKGLALGAELVTNGGFDANVTGWSARLSATLAWNADDGGSALVDVTGVGGGISLATPLSVAAEKTYQIQVRIKLGTYAGTIHIGDAGAIIATISPTASYAIYTCYYKDTDASFALDIFRGTAATGTIYISSISVRELPGNHALQATFASRPMLSARVNLLTYTEQFDTVAWTKQSGCTVTANQAVAPDGTMTADLAVSNGSAGIIQGGIAVPNSPNIKSVWMRTVTGTATVILKDPQLTVTSLSCNLTTTWQRFSITETQSGGLAGIWIASIPASGIYIWGADLRMASDTTGLPAYQRVAAATDYDTSGFPLYLKFDGVDDSLATGTIDPGSVDKAQVFAGVRKLSDVAYQMLSEFSANITANNGAFGILTTSGGAIGATGKKALHAGLSGTALAAYDMTTFDAPSTNVMAISFDISGSTISSEIIPRVNGVSPTLTVESAGPSGTGNFGSYPLYIGRRGGTTLPFNGQLYSMIVRFSAANLSDAQIASTETYVNNLTKAY